MNIKNIKIVSIKKTKYYRISHADNKRLKLDNTFSSKIEAISLKFGFTTSKGQLLFKKGSGPTPLLVTRSSNK